jgi:RNA polymerase sigma-54 factor
MLEQQLAQRQQHKILPQQIYLLNLFHLNTLELEHRLKQELEDNPVLLEVKNEEVMEESEPAGETDFKDWEEYAYDDIPDYKTEYANFFSGEAIPDRPFEQPVDFRQLLKEQCRHALLEDKDLALADYLVDSLTEYGFLEESFDTVAENFSFACNEWTDEKEIGRILSVIQRQDPAGIGARHVGECLLLQLKRMDQRKPEIRGAIYLLEKHFTDLGHRNMDRIRHSMRIDEEELRRLLTLIGSLNMRPVRLSASQDGHGAQTVIPDFILTREGDRIEVSLYNPRAPSLHIDHAWADSIGYKCPNNQVDKSTRQYVKSKLMSAEWFISAIQQREDTMLRVMKAIVQWQHAYFEEGDELLLRPMILKNIAEKLGLDISTVSRITSNKYVSTPFGIVLLKKLFTEGLQTAEGDSISTRVIRSAIGEIVGKEDKQNPFTDEKMVLELSGKG